MLLLVNALLSLTLLLWLRRSQLALKTLREVPEVRPVAAGQASSKKISVLIPARNEEKNLTLSLPSLLRQTGIAWECLVANDRSGDGTEAVLKQFGFQLLETAPAGTPGRYLNIREAGPASWTGKNFALAQLVPHASGDWFLFTDADTVHEPSSLLASVMHAEKRGLDFLTLLPRCITGSFLERAVQPTAMGLMGLWFPLFRVNDKTNPLFFANGQFLLIRRELYERLGGHAAVAHEFLEDFALMRKAKTSGAACACHFGQPVYGTRMYRGFLEIWRGWRRIYRHAAQDSSWVLLKWLAGVFAGSILPFVLMGILAAAHGGSWLSWGLGLINAGLLWATAAKTYRMLRVPAGYALLHPLAAFMICGILMDALRLAVFKRTTRWR